MGEFLQSRRARVTPEQVGLPGGTGRRRVPGLRREELAQAAGVSVDYYVRLEQGRSLHVSDAVLGAIGRVLGLTPVEQEHMRNLARPERGAEPDPREVADDGLQRLLDLMDNVPAMVLGRRMDLLAWNAAAEAVFSVSSMSRAGRNAARHTFLDPQAPELYNNWNSIAAEVVAHLRLEAGRHPNDRRLTALIGELAIRSREFSRLWATNEVGQKTAGTTLVHHPLVGELRFNYRVLTLTAASGQCVTTYSYDRGSPTQERLQLLLSWMTPAAEMKADDPAPPRQA